MIKLKQPKALRGRKAVHTAVHVGGDGTLYVLTLDNGDVWTKLLRGEYGSIKARWRCVFRALPSEVQSK